MRKSILIFLIIATNMVGWCQSHPTDSAVFALPDGVSINLGKIKDGKPAEGEIRFRNDGNKDLVITRIYSDCSCTVPSYPRDPIPPGGSGVIKAVFDPKGRRPGSFLKILKVRSNAVSVINKIYVRGNIAE